MSLGQLESSEDYSHSCQAGIFLFSVLVSVFPEALQSAYSMLATAFGIRPKRSSNNAQKRSVLLGYLSHLSSKGKTYCNFINSLISSFHWNELKLLNGI